MGRSVGRLDWWNIKDEHTEYEWQCQLAMYLVAPFGERRQDIRQAYHTAHIMTADLTTPLPDSEWMALVTHLSTYLQCDQDKDDAVDLDALKRMKEKQESCQDSETT